MDTLEFRDQEESGLLSKYREFVDSQMKKQQKRTFQRKLCSVSNRSFTIISSNCIGGLLYQLIGIPYATPTVGLFFFAPCFVKFASNLRGYLRQDLIQITESKYPLGNVKRRDNGMYPLGRLGDVEIHFMHYSSWGEAVQKWTRRTERVNFDDLFFLLTDQDLCTHSILEEFDRLPLPKKVCFTAKQHNLASCIQVPYYEREAEVGNLVANYHLFNGCFDFAKWFDDPATKVRFEFERVTEKNIVS